MTDRLTCDQAHPQYSIYHPEGHDPPKDKGWKGLPFTELDGKDWPVSFAAGILELDEQDLRDLIRIAGLQASGVLRISDFRRSGRQPKAYPATGLIRLAEVARSLREEFLAEGADN